MTRKDKKQKVAFNTQQKVSSTNKASSGKTPLILFIVLNVIFFANIILLSIITLSNDRGQRFYGVSLIKGIPYDQEIMDGDVLRVSLIKLKRIKLNNIKEDDFIVVPNSRNEDYLWGAKVISVDHTNKTVVAAVNDYYIGEEETVSFDLIEGRYAGESSFFGKMIFIATQVEGLIFVVLISTALSASFYFGFVRRRFL